MSMSSPPDAAGSAGGDPAAGSSDDDSQDQPQGYTIQICVDAQNKMTVSVQPGTDSDSDGDDDSSSGGDSDGDSQAQPVKSLNDLVSLVKDIVRSGGQMESQDDRDQFAAGAGESQ